VRWITKFGIIVIGGAAFAEISIWNAGTVYPKLEYQTGTKEKSLLGLCQI
jgi:hypothetical protein